MSTGIRTAIISLLLSVCSLHAQKVSGVYKTESLLARIKNPDTTYVVNFWATWCKPCIQELPAFDSLLVLTKNLPAKVMLVSLDFKEDIDKNTNPFLAKKSIQTECVLLDEVNGNEFINKIHEKWTGAIPATLIKHGTKKIFLEKKITLSELRAKMKEVED